MIVLAVLLSVLMVPVRSGEPMGPAFSLTSSSTLSWEGSKPGGGHYGIVDVVNGNIYTDNGAISGGSFSIDMRSIVVQDIKNENMNERLVGHLKSDDFFHVEKYPNADFRIFSVAEMSPKAIGEITATHMVSGDLKIKDRVQRISFPAEISMEGDQVFAKTSDIIIDRTKWDITTMSKSFFAELKDNYVDDEFKVRLDLRFTIN
jgi:polyisoprenoid-binding protein YceI